MLIISANKTKMAALMKTKGYHPNPKTAIFQKLAKSGSAFLIWEEPGGRYRAYITAVAGKPYMEITDPLNMTKEIKVSLAELQKCGLTKKV